MHYVLIHLVNELYRFTIYLSLLDDTDVFRVKKSYHSKKIVKQLKKEYKDDLEKTTTAIPEQSTRIGTKHLYLIFFFLSFHIMHFYKAESGEFFLFLNHHIPPLLSCNGIYT